MNATRPTSLQLHQKSFYGTTCRFLNKRPRLASGDRVFSCGRARTPCLRRLCNNLLRGHPRLHRVIGPGTCSVATGRNPNPKPWGTCCGLVMATSGGAVKISRWAALADPRGNSLVLRVSEERCYGGGFCTCCCCGGGICANICSDHDVPSMYRPRFCILVVGVCGFRVRVVGVGLGVWGLGCRIYN